jgi:hypothetical protein
MVIKLIDNIVMAQRLQVGEIILHKINNGAIPTEPFYVDSINNQYSKWIVKGNSNNIITYNHINSVIKSEGHIFISTLRNITYEDMINSKSWYKILED